VLYTYRVLRALPVLRQIREVEGWLLDDEADLLLAACTRATAELPGAAVVEVGSYCGRSTIVLASAVADSRNGAVVFAIDPHEGEVGAADQRIWSVPPTLERFNANIEQAGLRDHVVTIQQRSFEVVWQEPIALLLIDGLHDRGNVERDFRHFEPWLDPAGYVAFHDYSGWYPGVVAFVDQLVASENYERVDQAESLALLRPRRG